MTGRTFYNPKGDEAAFDGARWSIVVRGCKKPSGEIVVRGGPSHPGDEPVMRFDLRDISAAFAPSSVSAHPPSGGAAANLPQPSSIGAAANLPQLLHGVEVPPPVRETFHDALLDYRDLLGNTTFRNKPVSPGERRLFAAAYDAAQVIRGKVSVLGVSTFHFMLSPSLCFRADCFARDAQGAFWLMWCASVVPGRDTSRNLSLAPYVLEQGGYVPSNASVRLGVWALTTTGARFAEVRNDRIAARDAIIDYIGNPPF